MFKRENKKALRLKRLEIDTNVSSQKFTAKRNGVGKIFNKELKEKCDGGEKRV